jgi:hypothetical protein
MVRSAILRSPMLYPRSFISAYFLYVGVIGAALIGTAFGLNAIVTPTPTNELRQQAQREPTLLDQRIDSAREIRAALTKPLLRPAPLPPITVRVTHVVGPRVLASKVDRRKLMDEARGAFASIEPSSSDVPSSAYAEPDRHAVR